MLARDQEGELRGFLAIAFGAPASLESELRRLAQRHESLFGTRVEVVVAADTPELPPEAVIALVGAVGEALTNAGKHAEAGRVVVYAEPADPDDDGGEDARVFVSVKDDGRGFDPETVPERIGLSSSIRGRIDETGGTVRIASRPGRGTEVRLWL